MSEIQSNVIGIFSNFNRIASCGQSFSMQLFIGISFFLAFSYINIAYEPIGLASLYDIYIYNVVVVGGGAAAAGRDNTIKCVHVNDTISI